ncbi:MAG: dihydrolipoamide acetyltransferase family protein, partial [Acidobacteriota bacterium]
PSREGLVEVIEMTQMRKAIAEHMVRSKHTSAHTYTVAEVDMTRIVRFRESIKDSFQRENGFKLTFTPFILHATVRALKAHPLMNSSVEGDRILQWEYVNLGVAVAIETGLIVPVIKQADEKNLLGLARAANDLAVRAHNKKLVPDDVQGGTFTVTNPGVFGNIFGFPIINQPQVGILGVGAIKRRPVVIDDAIAIRSIMYVSLSYDHRVVDGALAARFLQEIRGILEDYDTDRAL